jgi:type I restriction enzyme S subunit
MNTAWEKKPIGEVVSPVERAEVPIPGKYYRQIGVRLWGQGAYEREILDGGQTRYQALYRVETGDIIVNKIWARNGSVAVVNGELAGCFCSGEFPIYAPDRNRLEPRWFHWITKTNWFWYECDLKSRGTSGKNRIRPEKFLEIQIPFPPLEEQQRIVAKIDELAAKIEETSTLQQQAEAKGERLLISMAHRHDLNGDAKERENWKWVSLGEVLLSVDDSHRVETERTYSNFGIYSFGRGLFKKQPIDGALTSATTLRRAKRGQFVYSRLFAFEGAYGMVTDDYDGFFVSNEYPTFDCDQSRMRVEFLWVHFKSPAVWKEVAVGSKGLGDRRQRVQPAQLLSYRLWLPPLEWQNRIAEVQTQVNALKLLQRETTAELDALLPSVLDKAFKGEL